MKNWIFFISITIFLRKAGVTVAIKKNLKSIIFCLNCDKQLEISEGYFGKAA